MNPELSGLQPVRDAQAPGDHAENDYDFYEVSPEEQAARCVNAIWSAHADEMERAIRKLSENA